jgi:hypothetical protein
MKIRIDALEKNNQDKDNELEKKDNELKEKDNELKEKDNELKEKNEIIAILMTSNKLPCKISSQEKASLNDCDEKETLIAQLNIIREQVSARLAELDKKN